MNQWNLPKKEFQLDGVPMSGWLNIFEIDGG